MKAKKWADLFRLACFFNECLDKNPPVEPPEVLDPWLLWLLAPAGGVEEVDSDPEGLSWSGLL